MLHKISKYDTSSHFDCSCGGRRVDNVSEMHHGQEQDRRRQIWRVKYHIFLQCVHIGIEAYEICHRSLLNADKFRLAK
jgi:hypothetical protein